MKTTRSRVVLWALLLCLAALTPAPARARETNAQRMARGLPPLPPRGMARHSRAHTTTMGSSTVPLPSPSKQPPGSYRRNMKKNSQMDDVVASAAAESTSGAAGTHF
ncbi:hypothetical protein HMN09_00588600 [Mycena chlorophos]|uniref:Uncharacterized protein n=1 Tax=Mycena chlorophos TaxID=658473 RepID=A0A8H6T4Y2_MYCCL|nr:hypothetical protein HMN09_00588600 [Mycena chlorophos]